MRFRARASNYRSGGLHNRHFMHCKLSRLLHKSRIQYGPLSAATGNCVKSAVKPRDYLQAYVVLDKVGDTVITVSLMCDAVA